MGQHLRGHVLRPLGPRVVALDALEQGLRQRTLLVRNSQLRHPQQSPRGPRIGGFAIGLAVAADILVGGPVTGAAMNPARWFGPAVASGFFDNAYVWIVGPLLGAALAAIGYRYLFSPEAMAD